MAKRVRGGKWGPMRDEAKKKKPKKGEWVRGRRSGGALWDRRLKGSGRKRVVWTINAY